MRSAIQDSRPMPPGPRVTLYGLESCALIVKATTGIWYTNQTGGTTCSQPMAEGYLLPLETELDAAGEAMRGLAEPLHRLATGPVHAGAGMWNMSAKRAAEVDALLATHAPAYGLDLVLDASSLEQSHEAWLHVTIRACDPWTLAGHRIPAPAVLTWPNSD